MDTSRDDIVPSWRPALGDRVFEFDAFLSHERGDGSIAVAAALEALGLRVWHDQDAPVWDGNVQLRLQQALRASRFVLVCIGPRFRARGWCRAEYGPALQQGERARAERVLVVTLEEHMTVPPELSHLRVFGRSTHELQRLFAHLEEQNRLPFNPSLMRSSGAFPPPPKLESIRAELESLIAEDKENPAPRTEAWLRHCLLKAFLQLGAQDDQYGLVLEVCSNALFTKEGAPRFSVTGETRSLLRYLSLAMLTRSSEPQERFPAHVMLAYLAVADPSEASVTEFLLCLAEETDTPVVRWTMARIAKADLRVPDANLPALYYLALRADEALRDSPMLNSVPEAIRVHIVTLATRDDEMLNLEHVDTKERLSILDRRLREHLSSEDKRHWVAVEYILYDLNRVVQSFTRDRGHSHWEAALSILEHLFSASVELGGPPLTSPGMTHFLILELLLECRTQYAFEQRVQRDLQQLCDVLRLGDENVSTLPSYLERAVARIDAGEDADFAVQSEWMEYTRTTGNSSA